MDKLKPVLELGRWRFIISVCEWRFANTNSRCSSWLVRSPVVHSYYGSFDV